VDDQRSPAQVWADDVLSASIAPYWTGIILGHQAGVPVLLTALALIAVLVVATVWGVHRNFAS